jgi:Outer membrane protein beta-barrel domain
MKKVILVLIISASAIASIAQSKKTAVGGYGAGTAELTYINGKPALNLGAYGGVLLNHRWLIGLAGNNIFFKQDGSEMKENFQLNYYGLYSEYRFMPQRKVNVSLGVTGALGWLEREVPNSKGDMDKDGDFTNVIQPKVGINIKVTKFMQVQAYGSYRFTGSTNSAFQSGKDLNGASAGVGLVFGAF